jgi:cytochrome c oxidase cbb3-type subunit IV
MSVHSTYDALRHFADSWGLLAMGVLFLALAAWPFRPGARSRNEDAANLIFKDDDHV